MSSGQVDFSGENVRRNVLAVAAPMLVAQIVNLLYNIVDRIYIGKIPGEGMIALAGLGLCFRNCQVGNFDLCYVLYQRSRSGCLQRDAFCLWRRPLYQCHDGD